MVANVVELNVVVPLMNEPEVYPDGTNNWLLDTAKATPKKSPVPESPSVWPPVPKLAGELNVEPV
jgi:hypothetical protein